MINIIHKNLFLMTFLIALLQLKASESKELLWNDFGSLLESDSSNSDDSDDEKDKSRFLVPTDDNLERCSVNKTPLIKTMLARHIDEIPTVCTHLVKLLAKQLSYKTLDFSTPGQVLLLDNALDGQICTLLTKYSELNKKCMMHDFCPFFGSQPFFDERVNHYGIEFYIKRGCSFSFDEVQPAYTTLITAFKMGWKRTTLAEYPHLLFKRSEKLYDLLLKYRSFYEEDLLMRLLIVRFNMETDDKVVCSDGWEIESSTKDLICLWIQKTALDEFRSKFGFPKE